MYQLSSYVLGGIVTALVLTPFVSGPDRSFVGTLLATSAPEPIVSVNRGLKGNRLAPASSPISLNAQNSSVPQTVILKSIPASVTAPRQVPGAPDTDHRRLTNESPTAKSRLLEGCESAFSAITDRQFADIPGRCMAELPSSPARIAMLN